MPWWVLLIFLFVGLIGGTILARVWLFPKWVGELVIAEDPDDPSNDYLFFRSYVSTKDIRKERFVTLKVVERKTANKTTP